jgi:MFS family permease
MALSDSVESCERSADLGDEVTGSQVSRGSLRQLVVLAAVVLASSIVRTAVGPVQEAMRIALSLSDNQVAFLQGPTMALPIVLAAIPLGLMLDRHSRVRLLVIFAVSFTLGNVLTAMATNFFTLLAARCVIGLAATATLTAAFSMLTDTYAPEQRGRVSMLMSVSQMAGNSAAFAAGGSLLAAYGQVPGGWRWTLLWLTLPVVFSLSSLAALREPPRRDSLTDRSSFCDVWRALSRCRSIAPLLAGMVMMEMIFGALYVWGAPAFVRTFGLSPARVGSIMAGALMISGFLGPAAGGMFADHFQRAGGPKRTMCVVALLALLTVPASLFVFVPAAGAASILFIVFTAIVSAAIVMGTAIYTVVTPSELRGLCVAIWFAAATLFGLGLAPVSVSILSGVLGGEQMLGKALSVFSLAAGLLGTGAFAFSSRSYQPLVMSPSDAMAPPGG